MLTSLRCPVNRQHSSTWLVPVSGQRSLLVTASAGSQCAPTAAAPPPAHELLGPLRPKPFPTWKHRYFKILIVGDSGLGKTTLVRALLSVPGQRLELHDGAGRAAA